MRVRAETENSECVEMGEASKADKRRCEERRIEKIYTWYIYIILLKSLNLVL